MSEDNMNEAKAKLAEKRAAVSRPVGIRAKFAALQGEMTPVAKDRENPFFKSNYATLKAIMAMLSPLLAKHGLAFTQTVEDDERGARWMRTDVFDDSSEAPVVTRVPFACAGTKAQDIGSATTYMRRYGLQCAFGVVVAEADDDDDGNRASGRVVRPAAAPKESEF